MIPHITSFVGAAVMFAFQGMAMGMLDAGGNVVMLALWRGSKFLNGLLHGFHFVFGFGALVGPAAVNVFRYAGLEGSMAWMGTGVCLMPCCIGFGFLCFLPQPDMIKEEEGAASPWTRAVVLSAVFLFLYVGNEVTYGGFITIFLEMHLGINGEAATAMASLYWGMLSLGRLVATAVTSHINHTRYLVAHLAVGIIAMSILGAVSTDPAIVTLNGLGWWAGVVVPTAAVGFAFAPLFPGAMLVTEELLGGAMSGRAASLIVTAAACGEAFFPILTGTAIPPHPNWFSWIMLASCCAMLAIFTFNAAKLIFGTGASEPQDEKDEASVESSAEGAANRAQGSSAV
jgi:FHS family Na+ dependent glucose MFS transporter 1